VKRLSGRKGILLRRDFILTYKNEYRTTEFTLKKVLTLRNLVGNSQELREYNFG
jgi:hypothetical protein